MAALKTKRRNTQMEEVILDNTLRRVSDKAFAQYLCHAFCRAGSCTFERHDRQFRMEAGDCLIISRRGDLVRHVQESEDLRLDVVYVTQSLIEICTPLSNYGTRGHLALFENPIMQLTPAMQTVCGKNFDAIRQRLERPQHHFFRDALINAVQCMIVDFFDFHAELYGSDRVTSQHNQLMTQFIEMLEGGDFRQNREVGYYADKLCVTAKYLSEVSKRVSGLPANYWITRYAALDISRLLRNRRLSLTEISDMFGFSSLAHFSRYVQNNLGANPSDLRE